MAPDNLREWALKGAEQRLVDIAAEARAIFVAFPELRGEGRGFDSARSERAASGRPAGRTRRRKRKMSPEGRQRIADAQRARWAKQKAASGNTAATTARPARPARKTAAVRRSRKKR